MSALVIGSAAFSTNQNTAPITATLTLPSGTDVLALWVRSEDNGTSIGSPTVGGLAPTSNTLSSALGGVVQHRLLVWDFTTPQSGAVTFEAAPPSFDRCNGMWLAVSTDVTTGSRLGTPVTAANSNNAPSTGSITCPSGAVVVGGALHSYADSALTAGSGVTLGAALNIFGARYANGSRGTTGAVAFGADTAGNWSTTGLAVLGDAPADTTAPTLTSPTGTGGTLTGTWSVSSTEAGTLYFRTTPTSTPATVPAVPGAMTGWSSVAMTAGVNTGSFGALTAGTHFPQFAADDGASPVNRTAVAGVGSSFVVTATPATARPASDVTTAGWTASTGTNFAALLDEVSPSDADFITSPPLSGSTAPVTVALDTVLIAGSWAIGVRARTTSGAGTVRVYLLNDAGTVVGTSGLQAITSTFATYSLPVTTSGIATRARIETLSS